MDEQHILRARLDTLARNLLWAWHPDVIAVFRDLDPDRWRAAAHNPVAFLNSFPPAELNRRIADLDHGSRINYAYHRLSEYLSSEGSWGASHAGPLRVNPVAYFSAEFGLHESLPIYSGGLGILAGDHLKSASDLDVPLVGIGLLYAQGYFRQRVDGSGWQQEEFGTTDFSQLPLERVTDGAGRPITIPVEAGTDVLRVGLWQVQVGRRRLLLLGTDIEDNGGTYRELTSKLYGGDKRTRLRQELVLGIGGVRALEALGITPGILHLNEGHSAFALLEAIRRKVKHFGLSFEEARRAVAMRTVFTTHTPVPAGHDWFSPDLIIEHLGWLADDIGISRHDLLGLGRMNPDDEGELFCMTVLGLKHAWRANGVSAIHGHVSRRMWHGLWPNRLENEVPIGHITNGVHVPTWLAPSMARVYERQLGRDWASKMTDPRTLAGIAQLDPGELWEAQQLLKRGLIDYVGRRLAAQARRRDEPESAVETAGRALEVNALTIGFARRFASYKRATLLFEDLDRLSRLFNDPARPVQILMAGKSHPGDEEGKRLIQQIVEMSRDPRFAGKIVFLEDYDIDVARHLVQGVDLWLNNPERPLEACGTSGQKVLLNGGLNCSVLDGWWAEAYDGTNGFAIGTYETHRDPTVQRRLDAAALYEVLEREVIPLYYDRNQDGVPWRWVQRVKRAVMSLAWRFNADRMLLDYARECYLPEVDASSCDMGVAWAPYLTQGLRGRT